MSDSDSEVVLELQRIGRADEGHIYQFECPHCSKQVATASARGVGRWCSCDYRWHMSSMSRDLSGVAYGTVYGTDMRGSMTVKVSGRFEISSDRSRAVELAD